MLSSLMLVFRVAGACKDLLLTTMCISHPHPGGGWGRGANANATSGRAARPASSQALGFGRVCGWDDGDVLEDERLGRAMECGEYSILQLERM